MDPFEIATRRELSSNASNGLPAVTTLVVRLDKIIVSDHIVSVWHILGNRQLNEALPGLDSVGHACEALHESHLAFRVLLGQPLLLVH